MSSTLFDTDLLEVVKLYEVLLKAEAELGISRKLWGSGVSLRHVVNEEQYLALNTEELARMLVAYVKSMQQPKTLAVCRSMAASFAALQLEGDLGSIEDNLNKGESNKWHYGKQELRQLLDFVYGSAPRSSKEELK